MVEVNIAAVAAFTFICLGWVLVLLLILHSRKKKRPRPVLRCREVRVNSKYTVTVLCREER